MLRLRLVIFIEEKGAVIGQFEEAVLGLVGPGEGALDVAEEFAFQQALHQGGAVHRHELPVPAGTEQVDGPGRQFLAGAALAG